MNDPGLHARASALFVELRALPVRERGAALERACGADVALREEVRSLLRHDSPATELPLHVSTPVARTAPERIGPYRVVARIGTGGTGQVFLAEQEEPVRRRVAVKVVPAAALRADLAARFEVERRALECTDHPGIARILDTGRTGDGVPYLVMDHVDGVSITAHADAEHLSLDERIELVLAVADAVQHAHQRGVIHRDLKPANVLVARADGRPRVVDFGIAKAVPGTLEADLPLTAGLPMGTPSWMAPEQTRAGEIDTRADVYGLGAVLYELCAGRPPIELDAPASGDPAAVLARIRDEVPPHASRARERAGLPPHEARCSARDVDLVLAKALEKDPARRYPSVGALAEDLRRVLRRDPVEARAPTRLYRATRFVQRNRVLVGSVATVTLALVAGVLGLALGLLEARRQRATALDQMDAQAEINRFLTDDLLAAASPEREGRDATVRAVLEAASANVEERFPTRPLVAAAVHHTLGEAFAQLGEFERAGTHLARAVALRHAAGGGDAPDTVRSEIAAASLVARRERYAEARPLLEAAVGRARLVLGPDDTDLYTALNDLGVALESVGELDAAEEAFEEALAGRTRLLGPGAPDVIETVNNLSFVLAGRGDGEGALELLLGAQRDAEAAPSMPRMTLLGLANNVGATYQDLGRDAEAAPHLRRAAELAAELLGPGHPTTLTIRGNLAGLEAELGDPARAAELYAKIAETRAATLGPDAPDTLVARYGRWDAVARAGRHEEARDGFAELLEDAARELGERHWLVPHTQSALARALYDCGELDDALALAAEAEEQLAELLGPDHPRTRSAQGVVTVVEAALAAR